MVKVSGVDLSYSNVRERGVLKERPVPAGTDPGNGNQRRLVVPNSFQNQQSKTNLTRRKHMERYQGKKVVIVGGTSGMVPMKRWGTPEEIAKAVLFLV